jgi:hypothetical protein
VGTTSSLTSVAVATFPTNGQGPPDIGGLSGVSCPPSGACIAVGEEILLDGHDTVYDNPIITTITGS